jgi:hypothetical protein
MCFSMSAKTPWKLIYTWQRRDPASITCSTRRIIYNVQYMWISLATCIVTYLRLILHVYWNWIYIFVADCFGLSACFLKATAFQKYDYLLHWLNRLRWKETYSVRFLVICSHISFWSWLRLDTGQGKWTEKAPRF